MNVLQRNSHIWSYMSSGAQVVIPLTCPFSIKDARSLSLGMTTIAIPSLLLGAAWRLPVCSINTAHIWNTQVPSWNKVPKNNETSVRLKWPLHLLPRVMWTVFRCVQSFSCAIAMSAEGFGLWTFSRSIAFCGRAARSQSCSCRRTLASKAAYSWIRTHCGGGLWNL